MVMAAMMGGMAGNNPMMAPSDDPVGPVSVYPLRCRRFEGPPKFRISAATTDATGAGLFGAARPRPLKAASTLRGSVGVETSDLPWRIAKVDSPKKLTRFQ